MHIDVKRLQHRSRVTYSRKQSCWPIYLSERGVHGPMELTAHRRQARPSHWGLNEKLNTPKTGS